MMLEKLRDRGIANRASCRSSSTVHFLNVFSMFYELFFFSWKFIYASNLILLNQSMSYVRDKT